jgi:hypothetical protein
MSYTITIKKTLSDEFLGDVMTTMIESGYDSIFNWEGVVIDRVERDDDLRPTRIELHCDSPFIDGDIRRVVITPARVAIAIEQLLDKKVSLGYPLEYIQRAVAEDDAGDIDATAADCIAQVIVLGVCEYG